MRKEKEKEERGGRLIHHIWRTQKVGLQGVVSSRLAHPQRTKEAGYRF
jgi:hypothetical protein